MTVWETADRKRFNFATVFGAGHMVPRDKPVKALALFDRFVTDKARRARPPLL